MKGDLRHLPAVYQGNVVDGVGTEIRLTDFPVEHYPRTFSLIRFQPAGLLSGVDRGCELNTLGTTTFSLGGKALTECTVRQAFKNGPFALMLAKIAYCYAAAEMSCAAFDGDAIRALLRKERDDVYNFVGSASRAETLSNRHLHTLHIRQRGQWLTVLVHLFASLHQGTGPVFPYEVVVGRLTHH